MEKETTKKKDEELLELLHQWQCLEIHTLEKTAEIIQQTTNPLIRRVMEIIRNDSLQHHRVQQFIIDTMTKTAVSLTPEEMAQVWSQIEEHDRLEKKTVEMAKKAVKNCRMPVQKVLLEYLVADEEKHDRLLENLGEVKKGMYPYG